MFFAPNLVNMNAMPVTLPVGRLRACLASAVFDGARAFEGVAPDLDLHCERVNQSAINFKLKPVVDTETWLALACEGIARFDANAELCIRPMYWAQTGSGGGVLFDPETTNWCLCIYVAPMPPTSGFAITLSPFRRPTMESAPVDCKAGCLYPNNSLTLSEAQARGFNHCLMLDMLGNVAEFGNSNVFMAKDGVVYTRAPNGTFLSGITRQRVIGLLRADGFTVVEKTLTYRDFQGADEIFPAAILPRSRRSSGSTTARCSRGRSTAAPASCTGILLTADRPVQKRVPLLQRALAGTRRCIHPPSNDLTL
jgi:branched-chain amino acid aminotransferase